MHACPGRARFDPTPEPLSTFGSRASRAGGSPVFRDGLRAPVGAGRAPEPSHRDHHAQGRYRGAPQRREVLPLQRPDRAGRPFRELPVLHRRPQRGHGGGAGSPPGPDLRARPGPGPAPHRGAVRGHRRAGEGGVRGGGAREQVPGQHPRGRRRRPRAALLRGSRHHPRAGRRGPGARPGGREHRAGPGRPGHRGARRDRVAKKAKGGDKEAVREAGAPGARPGGARGRPAGAGTGRGARGPRPLPLLPPPHVQAGALPGQRGGVGPPLGRERLGGRLREVVEVEEPHAQIVAVCSAIEAELAELEPEAERGEFLADLGLAEPGLHRLIRTTYDLLGLITFFTAGEKEAGPGPCARERRRPRPPGRSTRTSNGGSSGPRRSTSTSSRGRLHEGWPGRRGRCAPREGVHGADGDIMLFRFNV
jgi:hypothetical protein